MSTTGYEIDLLSHTHLDIAYVVSLVSQFMHNIMKNTLT